MWSSFQYIVFVFSLCASPSIAIPSPLAINLDPQRAKNIQPATQNTTLGQIVPTAFTVVPGILTGTDLPKTSCLLQTLVGLGQMAVEDFNGRQQATTFVHPLIAIELDGRRPGAALDRKYAIWGFYGVMAYMLREDDFHERLFTLRWKTAIVGRVRFTGRIRPHLSGSNSTMNEIGTSAPETNLLSLSNATTASQDTTLGTRFIDGNLEYRINPMGQWIAESDIYMTIATALVQAAPIPADDMIQIFDVDTRAFNSHLLIRDSSDPPRSSFPFLRQRVMIKVLIQIPALMLVEDNHWSEADLSVKIDNIMVATGYLHRVEQLTGSGSGSLDSVVSTS